MTAHQVVHTRPAFGPDEQEAVRRVLASGKVVQGEEVAAFEYEFSGLVGDRHCVAVNSGTSALHLAMLAAGIGAGDEVVVPSFTFAASANAVAMTGAKPVFADIDPATFCLEPGAVAAALTPRTVAVMAVHLFGQPASIAAPDGLDALCRRHGLLMVEDACQAHGAAAGGRPAGAWGRLAAFSFYATKNMTTGEGGMVVTDDAELARTVRLLRNQGMEDRYRNEIVGLNNRMTDIAAAIGRVQLPRLADWNQRRRDIAAWYDASLQGVTVPVVESGVVHVYHQYTVRHPRRDELREGLAQRDIETGVFYPVPAHRLPVYADGLMLPVTDRIAHEVLSLPVRPDLGLDEVNRVVDALNEVTGKLDE